MDLAKKIKSRASREKGFLTMALLQWLPLLIVIVSAISIAGAAFMWRTRTNSLCFQSTLKLQVDLRKQLEALIKLNPHAKSLRIARKIAEANLKAAIATANAPWIAEATAKRTLVIAQQLALKTQQQLILQNARIARVRSSRTLANHLKEFSAHLSPSFDNFKTLAVRPTPPGDLTPDYLPINRFEVGQAQQHSYSVELFRKVPTWIFQHFQLPRRQTAHCGATLKSANWELSVIKDKRWLNLL